MSLFARILNRAGLPTWRKRHFEGGAPGGRRWADGGFGPVNAETGAAQHNLRRRARHAMANNPHAAAAVNAYAHAIAGTGTRPTPQHPNAGTRTGLLALFDSWAPRADLAGVLSLSAMEAAVVRSLVVDGEAIARMDTTPDGLRLQLIPSELLASESREIGGGGYIVNGVEFDSSGRRVAFHIHPTNPASPFAHMAAPVRVPADDVLHVLRPLLPGQARGVSWLAPVLLRLHEQDQLNDALLMGVKVAAMHSGFVIDQHGSGPNPFATGDGTGQGGALDLSLEPGTVRILPSGLDVKFSTPQQAQQTAEFVRHQLRSIAAGLGLPAHLISADLTEANYGSLRAGMIAFRQAVEAVQHGVIIPMFLQPVWERLVSLAVLRGDLDAPGFEDDPAPYFAVEWLPPRAPWLDPAKDAQAEATMIAAGLKSRRQAVAELGYDVEALDAEAAADCARERRLGLGFGAPPARSEGTPDA